MFEEKLGGHLFLQAMTLYREVSHVLRENWIFYGQIKECIGSIPANIAEGNGRLKPDGKAGYYQNFLLIARGSALEATAWLQVGQVDGVFSDGTVADLCTKLVELADELMAEIHH